MSDLPGPVMKLSVHEALTLVMGAVQAVGKDGRNQQQGFNFRGIDAVVNAVGPALREHGVIVLPRVLSFTSSEYATSKGTQMFSRTVEVEFTFVGPDGSLLVCSALGEASDAGDKATSKAHSVAFRTALLQALCIPTDEPDPDSQSHERAPAAPAVIPKYEYERIRDLIAASDKPAEYRDAFRKHFGCGASALPLDRLDEANDWLSDLEATS